MKDIKESLQRALVQQGWLFGDKISRLGNPFEWPDNQRKSNILDLEDSLAIRFYFTMLYVQCATTEYTMIDAHDEVKAYCESEMWKSFKHFFPFVPRTDVWRNYIESQALVRTQDYCFLKKYCPQLPQSVAHLDIGPGLGSSALYSLKYFDSRFYALEASPMSYAVQRNFLRYLSSKTGNPGEYLDIIECENFQLSEEQIRDELNEKKDYCIKHVPSWHFPLVGEKTIDLVTAVFVLNEINYSGILWILAHASRVLKKGGYFYIRDAYYMRPGMHSIHYDNTLLKIGFERRALLEIENRHDVYGIPRVYEKIDNRVYSFDDMVVLCLGKYTSVAAGGGSAYNLETIPNPETHSQLQKRNP